MRERATSLEESVVVSGSDDDFALLVPDDGVESAAPAAGRGLYLANLRPERCDAPLKSGPVRADGSRDRFASGGDDMAENRRFRILVVDDHELFNWGFRMLLTRQAWIERCVTANTREESLAYTRRYEPHVALVGLFLGNDSGVDVASAIRAVSPSTRVLLLTGDTKTPARAVRSAGAAGFVSKAWRPDDLAAAVRVVSLGLSLTPPGGQAIPTTQLSGRERDVLELIAEGKTNVGIGRELSLSVHTVKQHASNIYRKLGARNRAEAVQRGEHLGYLD